MRLLLPPVTLEPPLSAVGLTLAAVVGAISLQLSVDFELLLLVLALVWLALLFDLLLRLRRPATDPLTELPEC